MVYINKIYNSDLDVGLILHDSSNGKIQKVEVLLLEYTPSNSTTSKAKVKVKFRWYLSSTFR